MRGNGKREVANEQLSRKCEKNIIDICYVCLKRQFVVLGVYVSPYRHENGINLLI